MVVFKKFFARKFTCTKIILNLLDAHIDLGQRRGVVGLRVDQRTHGVVLIGVRCGVLIDGRARQKSF